MAFFEEFEDMMPYTITVHNQSDYNQAGDLLQGTDTLISCEIEQKAQMIVDSDGHEVQSNTTIYCASIATLTPESLLTLPQEFFPRERLPIINIIKMSDEDGPSHLVIFV